MSRIEIRESYYSKPASIDREKGILRHVKIVGNESQHKRTYPPAALEKAKKLYEGMLVNNNHFREKGKDLPTDVRFGWLENVTAEAGGLFADCHIFDPQDSLARKLFTAAQHKPNAFGFSHHAFGSGRQVGEQFEVETIESVVSCDLVAEPATTKGLFESGAEPMRIKIRDLFESLSRHAKVEAPQRRRLCELLEMAPEEMKEPMAGQEMEAPPEEAPPGDQIGEAFKTMVCGVFDDKSLDARGKIKKITEILKAQEKLMGVEQEVKAEGDGKAADEKAKADAEAKGKGTPEDEKAKEEKEKMESVVHELALLKADKGVRVLVEDAGLKFAKPEHREAFIESLLPLADIKRKSLIEERRALTQEAGNRQTPRSAAPGRYLHESQPAEPKFPASRDEAKKLIALN